MSQRGLMITAVIVLCCIGLGYWLYANLEEREFTVVTPASEEVRRNPLLAVERLMLALGQNVESRHGSELLSQLPSHDDVVLIYRHNTPLTQPKLEALLAWVDSGGMLILDVAALWDRQREEAASLLLDYFEVEVIEREGFERSVSEVEFDDADGPVHVRFADDYRMYDRGDRASAVLGSRGSARLLQFDHGEGLVTFVNDLSMINNDNIGDHEHAYFAYLLSNTPGKLWLLYDPYRQSLVSLLIEHAAVFLLSLLLLGIAWIWHGARRLAPLQQVPSANRRNLIEHVVAIGHFDWRYEQLRHRYKVTQKHIEQRWLIRHPQLAALSDGERARWIAEQAGEPEQAVYTALYESFDDEPQFISRTALLARLRRWT